MLKLNGAESEIGVKAEVNEVEAVIDTFSSFLLVVRWFAFLVPFYLVKLFGPLFSSLYCFLFCYSSASFCLFSSFTFKIASPSAPHKTHSPVTLLPPFTGLGVTGTEIRLRKLGSGVLTLELGLLETARLCSIRCMRQTTFRAGISDFIWQSTNTAVRRVIYGGGREEINTSHGLHMF